MEFVVLPLVAVFAGAISITSPCCLPLLPGYVSYVSSLPGEGPAPARTALRASILFVLGFTAVFTLLGLTASVLGQAALRNLPMLTRVSGVLIVVMGLATLGLFRLPWLQREMRFDLARVQRGPAGAVPLGMAFAFGWTPCIGPVLASILTLAAGTGSSIAGAGLLVLYSLGLGIPFVAIGLGYQRLGGSVAFLRDHGRAIERLSGLLLVLVGLGYMTGFWSRLFIPLQSWFAGLGWPPI